MLLFLRSGLSVVSAVCEEPRLIPSDESELFHTKSVSDEFDNIFYTGVDITH